MPHLIAWTLLAMFVRVWSERHFVRGGRMGHDLVDGDGSDESCGGVLNLVDEMVRLGVEDDFVVNQVVSGSGGVIPLLHEWMVIG